MVFIGYTISMIESEKDNAITRLFSSKKDGKDKIEPSADLKDFKDKKKRSAPDEKKVMEGIMKLEVLELKLGIRLLQLVQGDSELLDKIRGIRKTIASELGFVIPQIRISDDTTLAPNEYQLYLKKNPYFKRKSRNK